MPDLQSDKTRLGLVGLGKMGLSHCALLNAHPDVDLAGVCDTSGFALGMLGKYSGLKTYSSMEAMLDDARLDAIFVATPSSTHATMVRECLRRGLSVFCEKPFTLDAADATELTALAETHQAVTQVGYHNRFVGAFSEVKRLLDASAIGEVTHVLGEAYGPVVLRPKGGTWRSERSQGGGCLYDYAAHVINLVNWYIGEPQRVGGTALNSVFSREIDDEVSSTMLYANGATAQVSSNWSDESQRKMTTRITLWGTAGRIFADRQECQVYLRDTADVPDGYQHGWNVRYTTDLTEPVGFYLRGEEYSAQVDHFIQRLRDPSVAAVNDFRSAAVTDSVIAKMVTDASGAPAEYAPSVPVTARRARRPRRLFRFRRRTA
jgi:scyllo-inositol 2-dehydrogenase (NADP+)